MSIEIRAARPDEMDDYQRLASYVFGNSDSIAASDDPQLVQPEWTTCAFVDGRLATTMGAYPFRIRLNGATVSAAGVTAVGTYPEFRRRGLLRRVIIQGFAEQREREQSLAILWASYGAIYQRFGYGLASTWVQYSFDPRDVALREPYEGAGSVSLARGDEALATIKRVYIEHVRPRNLMLHRADVMWQRGIMRIDDKKRRHIAIYRDEGGEARGYMVYGLKEEHRDGVSGPDQAMDVRDFVALDLDAYRALWGYIRSHDLVLRVTINPAEDDPAPALLLEPRALHRKLGDANWMRVVDVERALPQRPYGERGSLVIAVRDELCEWNDGTFQLESDGETTEVTRTDREPELTMPVSALARLLAGHASATELQRAGLIETSDDAVRRLADRMFATEYRPYSPDGY